MQNSLLITGRRWFDKRCGNTYSSARAYVDGVEVVHLPFEYGYGSHFEWTAWHAVAAKLGIGIVAPNGGYTIGARRYCDIHGLKYAVEVVDVQRKKDL